jgi:dUTP pyrophosphatase
MRDVKVEIKWLPHGIGLNMPAYETSDSAGMDLPAAVGSSETLVIKAGERAMVPTGISMALPSGFEAQIRPRSGLAAKNGVTVLNTPGTIDADYRGEVKIILQNFGNENFAITRGMRIAQMVIAPVTQAKLIAVEELDSTVRGQGGFGSTGVKS